MGIMADNFVFTVFSLLVAIMIGYIVYQLMQNEEEPPKKQKYVPPVETGEKGKKRKKKQHKVDKTAIYQKRNKQKKAEPEPVHLDSQLLSSVYRGHREPIDGMDVRSDNKMMVTVAKDGEMRVWVIQQEPNVNINNRASKVVPLVDPGSACRFSPNGSKICVALTSYKKQLQIWDCKLKKEKRTKRSIAFVSHEPVITFDTPHTTDIRSLEWGPASNFVITCATQNDTHINIWSLQGERLFELNTNQLQNNMASLSPDGRFLSAATRLADSKVWELKYGGADLNTVSPVMALKHKKEVTCICLSASNRVATVSVDGYWRVFDIGVRFGVGEDPKLLLEEKKEEVVDMIQLSPDGCVAALGAGTNLVLYDVENKSIIDTISVSRKGQISQLQFSRDGMLLAVAGGSKEVKLFTVPYPNGAPRAIHSTATIHIQEEPQPKTGKAKVGKGKRKGKGKKKRSRKA